LHHYSSPERAECRQKVEILFDQHKVPLQALQASAISVTKE